MLYLEHGGFQDVERNNYVSSSSITGSGMNERDSVHLTSFFPAFGHLQTQSVWPLAPTPTQLLQSFNELKWMDVASLDMLQFHWWDYSNSGYLDALKHLTDLNEEGKIKTIGLTNFDTEKLELILENGIPVVSNQV